VVFLQWAFYEALNYAFKKDHHDEAACCNLTWNRTFFNNARNLFSQQGQREQVSSLEQRGKTRTHWPINLQVHQRRHRAMMYTRSN
jgi:hypothetical protein